MDLDPAHLIPISNCSSDAAICTISPSHIPPLTSVNPHGPPHGSSPIRPHNSPFFADPFPPEHAFKGVDPPPIRDPAPDCRAASKSPLPLKDDSIDLILSPFLFRGTLGFQPPSIIDETLQSSTRPPLSSPDDRPHHATSQQASPPISACSDTIVEETQFADPLPCSPANAIPPRGTPIKAIPIQALTPNGSVCVLPVTPQLDTKKTRRRSSRLLSNEEGTNISARLDRAAKTKSLELAPTKKTQASSTALGSIEIPVLDFTDEELALLSTATGYRLLPDSFATLRASELGSKSA